MTEMQISAVAQISKNTLDQVLCLILLGDVHMEMSLDTNVVVMNLPMLTIIVMIPSPKMTATPAFLRREVIIRPRTRGIGYNTSKTHNLLVELIKTSWPG
jgi:hypothetical protein